MKHNPDMNNWEFKTSMKGLPERICPHGCGHPDPEYIEELRRIDPERAKLWGVHGCDGCCCVPEEGDEDEPS